MTQIPRIQHIMSQYCSDLDDTKVPIRILPMEPNVPAVRIARRQFKLYRSGTGIRQPFHGSQSILVKTPTACSKQLIPSLTENLMQADFLQDENFASTAKSKKYCRSCWREDLHMRINYSPLLLGFLMVVTCGLVLLVKPSRCVCCGTVRIN